MPSQGSAKFETKEGPKLRKRKDKSMDDSSPTVAQGEGKQNKFDNQKTMTNTSGKLNNTSSNMDKDVNNNASTIRNKLGGKRKSQNQSELEKSVQKKSLKVEKVENKVQSAPKGVNKIAAKPIFENVRSIKVGPSIHDGITVEVDTHEFDFSEDEQILEQHDFDSDESGTEGVEEIVEVPTDGATKIVENAPVMDMVENLASKKGSCTDEEYSKLLENNTLRRIFNDFYN